MMLGLELSETLIFWFISWLTGWQTAADAVWPASWLGDLPWQTWPLAAESRSITDRSLQWPTWEQFRRVLFAEDYNTRVVLLGTTLLGCAAGMVGSFTLLRKRALTGDALCHATLPGIGLAFLIGTSLGWNGKSLPLLLTGATLSGLLGIVAIALLRRGTKLKEDTALGIVLSVFFGAGIALLSISQQMEAGHAAGLESFILGKTASMRASDAWLIGFAAVACCSVCLLLFKEFRLLCFDEAYAGSCGYPVVLLDLLLMATVVAISIVGLQAVGLVLMIALLIIPAAAARFWTETMWMMLCIAATLGGIGCMLGAAASALLPRLPSGAMIVLVCAGLFLLSMIFGRSRGILVRLLRRWHINRTVDRHHVLRSLFECSENSGEAEVLRQTLFEQRTWSQLRLRQALMRAQHDGLVVQIEPTVRLTKKGRLEARRLTREHRLWELYLIAHADLAPSQVDRAADRIEHVLEPEVIAELESLLEQAEPAVPQNPHTPSKPNKLSPAPNTQAPKAPGFGGDANA